MAAKRRKEEEDQRKRHAEGKEREALRKRDNEDGAAKRKAHVRRIRFGDTFPIDDDD